MTEGDSHDTAVAAGKAMNERFAEIEKGLADLSVRLATLTVKGTVSEETLKHFKDAFFCMRMGMMLYAEAYRTIQAGAWFATAAVSAASLESILLAQCFIRQEEIKQLQEWKALSPHLKKDFGVFARAQDLGKLLVIADKLNWLAVTDIPPTFRETMTPHLGEEKMIELSNLIKGTPKTGQLCASYLHKCRNLLHPAVALKEGRLPVAETGQTATYLFLVVVTILSENVKDK